VSGETTFWDTVDALREARRRYAREAYGFVVGALGATVQALPPERLADVERRHLSGGELLEGVARLARREFGAMAPMVFAEWGVRSGEDVGEIVFELVRAGQLSARPEDTLDDFRAGFDLSAELRRGIDLAPKSPASPSPPGGAGGRPASTT
jgi:uncharacterized repeat protein (TIGR04138 family)